MLVAFLLFVCFLHKMEIISVFRQPYWVAPREFRKTPWGSAGWQCWAGHFSQALRVIDLAGCFLLTPQFISAINVVAQICVPLTGSQMEVSHFNYSLKLNPIRCKLFSCH